jgi:allophanate hydrolase
VADLASWRARYAQGETPRTALTALRESLRADDPAWISLADAATLDAQLNALELLAKSSGGTHSLSLYGVPFAVKDNIDVAGFETTAGCPEFAYRPRVSASAVVRLQAAGAVVMGKTNLDQFATGLNGTRSPYGAVPNTFNAAYVSGGSSSGSASAVARGLVPFSLGTDTAGSGRVPAGFNNIIGWKPSKGALSLSGVVPACRTLDCISIFALSAQDARTVFDMACGFDAADAFSRALPLAEPFASRLRVGVPRAPEFFGHTLWADAFQRAKAHAKALGFELIEIDFEPFAEAAALLYEGPWVAERFAAIESVMIDRPSIVHPAVRTVIEASRKHDAVSAFKAQYRLAELARATAAVWQQMDCMLVPTSPTIDTISAMQADPLRLNSRYGTYTNFVNLLDLCALALPCSLEADGLPFGVTFIAPAGADRALGCMGELWQKSLALPLGATGISYGTSILEGDGTKKPSPSASSGHANATPEPKPAPVPAAHLRLAVVGAHLSGMPLNHQPLSRGARLACATQTSARYRLHALPGTVPPKPGLERVSTGESGTAIALELWDVPLSQVGSFLAEIPSPLGLGSLELKDGSWVKGFICEPHGLAGATDVSRFGGWRNYVSQSKPQ